MSYDNVLPDGGQARRPRAIVKVNGTAVPGWVDWEVNNNSHYQADTFRVSFARSQLPAQFGHDWWASQTAINVEILAGFPPDPNSFTENQLTSWIYGNVDEIDDDPVSGLLTVSGRDLTSLLIDTKTTEDFREQTASGIATTLANRHGLDTSYIATTRSKVGTFYKQDHVHMVHEHSEWDLLCYLAAHEEFQVYVDRLSLRFEPRSDPSSVTQYLLKWDSQRSDRASPAFNGMQLNFVRNLTVARGIVVIVRSWHYGRKGAVTSTYPKSATGIKPGMSATAGGQQVYTFTRPNLTQQEADDFATAKHRELTRHEMKLRASMPADDVLRADSVVQVLGVGSQFDQSYFPDSVTRRMSLSEGYVMTLTAKNHNTDSETLP
ncbi:MAG: hypothetical protein KGN16_10355 [Burkholderiales bacterium]|nr:hypothetical protein [Burkholderiales bacterium]